MLKVTTKRLLLRPLGVNDLDAVHEYASDKDNCTYMMFLPNETRDETYSFLKAVEEGWKCNPPKFYEFAIELSGSVIGAISVYPIDSYTAELGWILNAKYQGNGYATEAGLAVRDLALNSLCYKKLIAHCDARNVASYSLMEKLGMKLEDDSKTRTNKGDTEPVKEFMYSLTRQEMV